MTTLAVTCLSCRNFHNEQPSTRSEGGVGASSGFESGSPGGGGDELGGPDTAGAGLGSSAASGGMGSFGVVGDGGDGNAGSGGITGAPTSATLEEVVVPRCVSSAYSHAAVEFTQPFALATTDSSRDRLYTVFATQPQGNVVLMRSRIINAGYSAWNCFDLVPHPTHLTAIKIEQGVDDVREVYASSVDGRLYVRRSSGADWLPWQQLGLPRADSNIIDVEASSGRGIMPFVYALDRSNELFVRHHVTVSEVDYYSPWKTIAGIPDDVRHVCGGSNAGSGQQVFVSTARGAVYMALQSTASPDSGFGAFQQVSGISTPTIEELNCGYSADNSLVVFALGTNALWSHRASVDSSDGWVVEPTPDGEKLLTFAVGSRADEAPTLFGTDDRLRLWTHVMETSVWQLALEPPPFMDWGPWISSNFLFAND